MSPLSGPPPDQRIKVFLSGLFDSALSPTNICLLKCVGDAGSIPGQLGLESEYDITSSMIPVSLQLLLVLNTSPD
jgi:hypothetical protein